MMVYNMDKKGIFLLWINIHLNVLEKRSIHTDGYIANFCHIYSG